MEADRSRNRPQDPTGPLSAADVPDRSLSVHALSAELIADGLAMRQLRASLDDIAASHGESSDPDAQIHLTRQHVMAVLSSIHSCLHKQLACPANLPEDDADDLKIKYEHPSMSLLNAFIGTLADLDNAKNNEVFMTPEKSRGASLRQLEVRTRDEQLALVDVVQVVGGLRSRAEAERKVEEMTRKKGGHSKVLHAARLKEMRKTRTRQRRRTRK